MSVKHKSMVVQKILIELHFKSDKKSKALTSIWKRLANF